MIPPQSVNQSDLAVKTGALTLLRYFAITALLITVCGTGWLLWRKKHSIGSPFDVSLQANAGIPLRKSLAVLGFHNVSGAADDAWLSAAFSEILTTELSAGQKLRLVSGEDVANLRLSTPWPETGTLDRATTMRIGTTLDSDLLVLGSFTSIAGTEGGQVRLDARLQDARTGEVLAEFGETGRRAEIFQITGRIGAKLRDRLGLPGESEAGTVFASMPLNRDAARFYALGIEKLRQFDALAAKDLLQQACDADPKFALGHVMLSRAWNQLGYERKRKQEARKAWELSGDLSRETRLQIEGDYYESLPDHENAASRYDALFQLFPDNLEYGLQLASAQTAAGHGSQALETLHRLRRLPPPGSDDPRIDLIEARSIPDNKPVALNLVQNAERKALAQGKRLFYAQARKEECMVDIHGYQPALGPPACNDAFNIFMAVGNRLQAADALRLLADGEGGRGNSDAALAIYERALGLLQQLGDSEKTGAVLNNMANILSNEGKLDDAEKLYRRAKEDFERSGDKYAVATALCNLADVSYERGNLAQAEDEYKETLVAVSKLDQGGPGYGLLRLADLELTRGQLLQAKKHAQEAIDSLRPHHGGLRYLSAAMLESGSILEVQEDFEGARRQFQSAIEVAEKIGAQDSVQESQVALARLALDQQRAAEAEPLLRAAIAEFEKDKEDPDTTSAYTELSRALLMESKTDDARKAIDRADKLARNSPDPALKLPIAIQIARVEMAQAAMQSKDPHILNRARQHLKSAAETARRLGYYLLECEARLALAELETKTTPAHSRARLNALVSETRDHGLELLARQAEAVSTTPRATFH